MNELELARAHAPCYIYRRSEIEARADRLTAALPGFTLLYSLKANPFPDIVRLLAERGFGADASSTGEVALAARCGIAPEDTVYTAPGRTEAEFAETRGGCLIYADSLTEVERLGRMASTPTTIGVRMHPDFSPTGRVIPTKFGIECTQLPELRALLRRYPLLRITGVHTHTFSQVSDADALGSYWQRCYELAERVCAELGMPLESVDLGSGAAVVFDRSTQSPFDTDRLRSHAEAIAERNTKYAGARLLAETGRYLTCEAGTYYTVVTDIKQSGGKRYLIVPNAVNGFTRPAIQALMGDAPPAEPIFFGPHGCTVSVPEREGPLERVTVAGTLCTNYDLLAEDILLPHCELGDLIAVSHAGAYAHCFSILQFASHPLPGEYLL